MAVLKCKMCGGDLEVTPGQSVAECEYCGSRQTVPAVDDEKKLKLFTRANRLRSACEFDKAAGIYETIVADFPEEAESYWGLVLCKYGIEYVDDPGTGRKIPTCHRSSFESVLDDSNLEQALENADAVARKVYREEARQIEELRKGIIAVSSREAPYDIFICYKETDPSGSRTLDSVLAQDIYDALTEKGYRVFFSRITLEDKLGQEYEPYIFAALNSAKIMLAVGTDYEYYNAVWVKNEWSRFLKLMTADKTKHLIPCYKGIDAYDMPKEFAKLQAQDLGKLGAMQDLLRGIQKLLPKQKQEPVRETAQKTANSATAPLLKRMFLFLESGKWSEADSYAERVLDQDPECGEAYLGKLLAEKKLTAKSDLAKCEISLETNENYKNALRFADPNLKSFLEASAKKVKENIDNKQKESVYNEAAQWLNTSDPGKIEKAAAQFGRLGNFRDARQMREKCLKKIEDMHKADIYSKACASVGEMRDTRNSREDRIRAAEEAAALLETILDFHNAKSMYEDCHNTITQIRAQTQAEKEAVEARKLAEKEAILDEARKAMTENNWNSMFHARKLLESIPDFQDADELLAQCQVWFREDDYNSRLKLAKESQKSDELKHLSRWFSEQGSYRDSQALAKHCSDRAADLERQEAEEKAAYQEAERKAAEQKRREEARKKKQKKMLIASIAGGVLGIWLLICHIIPFVKFMIAGSYYNQGEYLKAAQMYSSCDHGFQRLIPQYLPVREKLGKSYYAQAEVYLEQGELTLASEMFGKGWWYEDAPERNEAVKQELARQEAELARQEAELDEQQRFEMTLAEAKALEASGDITGAAMMYGRLTDYPEYMEKSYALWNQIARRSTIAAGHNCSFAVTNDGKVLHAGSNQQGKGNVQDWSDIISIDCADTYTVGLRSDGSVEFAGRRENNVFHAGSWTGIVDIAAGGMYVVGLKADGTVRIAGVDNKIDVSEWTEIVDVFATYENVYGLKADGTLIAGSKGYNATYKEIVAIAGYGSSTIGLKQDGTIRVLGSLKPEYESVNSWKEIQSISFGVWPVGLRKDGTVAFADRSVAYVNQPGRYSISSVMYWRDIVSISCNGRHVLGLRSDGTILSAGANDYDQCNVSGWTNIRLP